MRTIFPVLIPIIFFFTVSIYGTTKIIQSTVMLAPLVHKTTYKVFNLNSSPAEIKMIEIGTRRTHNVSWDQREFGIIKDWLFLPQYDVPLGWVGRIEVVNKGYYYIVFEVESEESTGIKAGSSLEFSVISDGSRLKDLQDYNAMYNYIRFSTSGRTQSGSILLGDQNAAYYEPFHFLNTITNFSGSEDMQFINPGYYGITDMPNSNWLVNIDFDIGTMPTEGESFRSAYIVSVIKPEEYAKFKTPVFDMIKRPPTNTVTTSEQSEFEVSFNLKYLNYWDTNRDGEVDISEMVEWYWGTALMVNFINSQTGETPYSFELFSIPEGSGGTVRHQSTLSRHNNDALTDVTIEQFADEGSGVGPFSKWKTVKLKSYSNGKIALFFGEDAIKPTWFDFTGNPMNNNFDQLEFVYGPGIQDPKRIAIDNIMVRKIVNGPAIHHMLSESGNTTNTVIPTKKFTIIGNDFGTDINNITVRVGNEILGYEIVAVQNLTQNSFEFEMPEIFGILDVFIEVNGIASEFSFGIVCPAIVPTIISPLLLN